jgi:hypothetical protein
MNPSYCWDLLGRGRRQEDGLRGVVSMALLLAACQQVGGQRQQVV